MKTDTDITELLCRGPIPTKLDDYEGELIMTICETRVMMHPSFREGTAQSLYIKVSLDGGQVQHSHRINNAMSETVNFRFHLGVPRMQPEGGSKIHMHLVCAQRDVKHPTVALGSILVNDVISRGVLRQSSWLDVSAITNGGLKLQCLYASYCPPLKTRTCQRSKVRVPKEP